VIPKKVVIVLWCTWTHITIFLCVFYSKIQTILYCHLLSW
jgi:hypothetical protein